MQFRAAAVLAALNIVLILKAAWYLLSINAIGSRTIIEVPFSAAFALTFFVGLPMLLIYRELPEPEKDTRLFFKLKRQILLGLAFLLVLLPSICYLILVFRG